MTIFTRVGAYLRDATIVGSVCAKIFMLEIRKSGVIQLTLKRKSSSYVNKQCDLEYELQFISRRI